MIPIEDLTDVTLVIEDTDEDHEDDEEDLTDVTPTQIELINFFTIIANKSYSRLIVITRQAKIK